MTTSPSTQQLLKRDAAHRSGLWEPDVAFVRGEGAYLWDADGKRYLDMMAGIAVASVGHANPRLAAAIAEQAGRLLVCPQNLANDTRTEFLAKLFEFVRPPLERAFLVNSGSEAVEAALKWARVATGRSRFVAARRGFSGRTLGALSLTWEPKYREPFAPLPYDTTFIDFNDAAALDRAVTDEVAAVLLEPIQGEGGVHPATPEFLGVARAVTRERGALLVLDEIQAGVGRTGTFLASEALVPDPDMVTLAKGLGGGVPIGALLMTDGVARAMPAGGHGTTFGGNPLAAAAGLAVLTELEERDLMRNAREVGAYLAERLAGLGPDRVRAVRGRGLMLGVELPGAAEPAVRGLRERGVLTINAGTNVIRFVPPLVVTREQVDEAVAALDATLSSVEAPS